MVWPPAPGFVRDDRVFASTTQVVEDVLALTKANYNACDFASALPITLKFADRAGEILIASPHTVSAPPLPFRHYTFEREGPQPAAHSRPDPRWVRSH